MSARTKSRIKQKRSIFERCRNETSRDFFVRSEIVQFFSTVKKMHRKIFGLVPRLFIQSSFFCCTVRQCGQHSVLNTNGWTVQSIPDSASLNPPDCKNDVKDATANFLTSGNCFSWEQLAFSDLHWVTWDCTQKNWLWFEPRLYTFIFQRLWITFCYRRWHQTCSYAVFLCFEVPLVN